MARKKGSDPIRLVTYNIHKGIGGVDRRYRPERIIEVLRACEFDIAFLQEVDEGVPRSRFHRQIDLLGDALGIDHRAFFPNVKLKRGHYGNAVLSRFPLDHVENIDLTRPFKKRRGGLHARLTIERGRRRHRLWLYNVHLGLAEKERRNQLRHLLKWHRSHRVDHSTVVVIGGDLNDVWTRLGPLVLEPDGFFCADVRPATFPAIKPMRPLDGLFVRGPVRITRTRPFLGSGAVDASDHLPLITSLRLG